MPMTQKPMLQTVFKVLVVLVSFTSGAFAKESLRLEDLYPDDGLFGKNITDASFSHDGRFAASEYRPHAERRHGSDVYVLHVASGEVRRMTSAELFETHRDNARIVLADRRKRLEKASVRPDQRHVAEPGSFDVIGVFGVAEVPVPNDDATSDDRPRYNGINSYTWSPSADEMLVVAGGDVYRLSIDESAWISNDDYRGTLKRLTRTRHGEASVGYLPDGSGFAFLRRGELIVRQFGDEREVQVDPRLEDGEDLVGYRFSPDGRRLVLLGAKNRTHSGQYTEVVMVRYRDRFADPTTLRRRLPDAEAPDGQASIYIYDLAGHLREDGTLKRVFTRKITGQRDLMVVPHWSPDSRRIAFAEYAQEPQLVTIYEAAVEGDVDGEASSAFEGESADVEISDAIPIYRFLHDGAPATPRRIVPRYLPDSRRVAFITDRTGYRHLFVLDPLYEVLRQVTFGRREVEIVEQTKDHSAVVYTATGENDPTSEQLFRVDLETGESIRLDDGRGRVTDVAASPDGTHAVAARKRWGRPPYPILVTPSGEVELGIVSPQAAHTAAEAEPEHFRFQNRHGHTIHGHMFRPTGLASEPGRPLLIFVYGGPIGSGRNMTARGSYNGDGYLFARYMAERHGYVTATVDPRGTSGFGVAFEKASFGRIGEPQAEDLADAADWLVANADVDPERRAIHGWSFGGFQTQYSMFHDPDIFAAGIAGAGPVQWENYDARYVTGVVGDFDPDEPDALNVLPDMADKLEGHLLLVHGMEDDNVLYQDTIRIYRELLQAGKSHLVELFVDPTGGHYLKGDVDSFDKYQKYEAFLLQHLGSGFADEHGPSTKPADSSTASRR
ncbi:MAG: prolyl oligopeptidase family serine peptidase [Planctomycetota bacterium]